jgi:hypothetical protein
MTVDRAWVQRNIGFDPISRPAPASTFAFPPAAKPSSGPEDYQREIIDFDSESPAGQQFFAFTKATGLARFTDIPWPTGLAPETGSKPAGGGRSPLPNADVLVVTWTVDEGHALSRVLTPGKDSQNDYVRYTHNFDAISKGMSKGSPAVKAGRLGTFWTATIAKKKVVVFKSDSHLSQDTNKKLPRGAAPLPNAEFWKQIIAEVRPKLVITAGTGGGIGAELEVGDVIVSPIVRFDSQKWLKPAPFHDGIYKSPYKPATKYFAKAQELFKANSGQLPQDNTRPPMIIQSTGETSSIVTTDFFGFDISDNHYGLKGEGDLCEMGDAVLGLVAQEIDPQPDWIVVRNVSDPQIKAEGTLKDQSNLASQIYKAYGRWSSVCSAIVSWSLIAAL